MKILHICLANFYIDNYSYQENILPKYHKKMGFDVSIIASTVSFDKNGKAYLLEQKEKTYFSDDNVKVTRLKYKTPFFKINKRFRRFTNLRNKLNQEKPDILFIHGSQFWDVFEVIRYKIQNMNIKIFIDNHADYINSAKSWVSMNILHKIVWRYCAKSIEQYVEKFWGVTPIRSKFLVDVYKINPNLVDTLIMGIDLDAANFNQRHIIREKYRKKHLIKDEDIVIISGGKIDELKNIDLLINAFKNIKQDNLKLFIFGSINKESKEQYNILFKCDKRIKFLDWQSSSEIYNLYYMSDIACFPGTHSVLWEQAIGLGLPTVLKKWDGFHHLEINESVVTITDIDKLQQVMEQIIPKVVLLKKIAENNHLIFSYEEIAKKAICL